MGYENPDLYYQPDAFGITPVGEVDWDDESCSFNITVVWQSKEDPQVFYWAQDSGCSCPAPFEGFTSLEGNDWAEVNKGTKHECIKALLDELERVKKVNESYSWRTFDPSDDVLELVGKLVRL